MALVLLSTCLLACGALNESNPVRMLATLRIRNLALVSDLTLGLEAGFNAVTGETGAGKSIVLGALNLVLGERADRTLIRSGADSCGVEAVFELASIEEAVNDFLDGCGLDGCEGGQLILKRTFTASGSNRQFINGSPASLQVLKSLGELLVDMHGPHDHQSLLHNANQLSILDAFGGLEPLRERYGDAVSTLQQLSDEKAELIVDDATYSQQLDLLRFQVKEISTANLIEGEEEEVEAEYSRASNAARIIELSQQGVGVLGEIEGSVMDGLGAVGRLLHEIGQLDPATEGLAELHGQVMALAEELQGEISSYVDRVEVDPQRLYELDERIRQFHALKRKYGPQLEDVIRFGEEAAMKLESLEARDGELERIQAEMEKVEALVLKLGRELGNARKQVGPKLAKAAVAQLRDLGFIQSEFEIQFIPREIKDADYPSTGLERVEFLFAPNKGEPARPLKAIASSGEMARVMLALKTVLAAEDRIPVLVFDEIDANVGGETAAIVGQKMGEIGASRQALCITHLAPVAAAAATHFKVEKEIEGNRTFTHIRRLGGEERVEELTRMLGGSGQAARQHARELLAGSSAANAR